jgi:hypothetical protein
MRAFCQHKGQIQFDLKKHRFYWDYYHKNQYLNQQYLTILLDYNELL